jgi:DNA-binding IclR family transcriptional regulator
MATTSGTSQTLDRGLKILEIIASEAREPTITEIAAALDVHRTIAHRLVATLEQHDFVARSQHNRFQLGTGLIRLASRVGGQLRVIARPALAALNEDLDETVHLVVPAGSNVLFLDAVESSKALRVTSRVGQTLPAYATSVGKAMLAQMSDEELQQLFPDKTLKKIAPKTLPARSDLFKQLETVRSHGYAMSSEESEIGVASIAAAIVDQRGTVRGALGIGAPVARLTPEMVPRLALAVQKAAKQIGGLL